MANSVTKVNTHVSRTNAKLLQNLRQAVWDAKENNPELANSDLVDMELSPTSEEIQLTLHFKSPKF